MQSFSSRIITALAILTLLTACSSPTKPVVPSKNKVPATQHAPAKPIQAAPAPRKTPRIEQPAQRPQPAARKQPSAIFLAEGAASYYGKRFHGRKTASGERFDMHQFTAAHKKLPFGSRVRVTNLHNNRSVVVTINDRGPYSKKRIIDLSKAAAKRIGMIKAGIVNVRVEVLL